MSTGAQAHDSHAGEHKKHGDISSSLIIKQKHEHEPAEKGVTGQHNHDHGHKHGHALVPVAAGDDSQRLKSRAKSALVRKPRYIAASSAKDFKVNREMPQYLEDDLGMVVQGTSVYESEKRCLIELLRRLKD